MIYESELYHHGIFGQKWGKRNGPPYPLGSSDHSASEKKAGWKDSLSGSGKSGNGNSGKEKKQSKKEKKQQYDSDYNKYRDEGEKKYGLDKIEKQMDEYFDKREEADAKEDWNSWYKWDEKYESMRDNEWINAYNKAADYARDKSVEKYGEKYVKQQETFSQVSSIPGALIGCGIIFASIALSAVPFIEVGKGVINLGSDFVKKILK